MSARFEERSVGVWDREAAALVLPHTPEWTAYQAHVAAHGEPDPQPPQPALELAAVLAEKLALVENLAGEIRRRITGRASPSEMASWSTKAAQAMAYQTSSNPADAPLLAAEALARGTTLAAIVTRVLNNSVAFLRAEPVIAGVSGKHKDAIARLTTAQDVAAYDINAGWGALWP